MNILCWLVDLEFNVLPTAKVIWRHERMLTRRGTQDKISCKHENLYIEVCGVFDVVKILLILMFYFFFVQVTTYVCSSTYL